ncbi:MAG: DNA gyrase C-terminal beta-propeller domain-containing protein, partial [Longimicrobiales bacterium]
AYSHVRVVGINAINVESDDELIDVQVTTGDDEIILATRNGMAIRFHESDVRNMGRTATGVRGVRLREDDLVVGMVVIRRDTAAQATLLVVSERGRGKRTAIDEYRFQSRGGSGVINFRVSEPTGHVVAIKEVFPGDELMMITRNGVIIRQRVNEIRVIGRATQGVRLLSLDQGDVLVDVARLVPEDESGEPAIGNGAPPDGTGMDLPEGESDTDLSVEEPMGDPLSDEDAEAQP